MAYVMDLLFTPLRKKTNRNSLLDYSKHLRNFYVNNCNQVFELHIQRLQLQHALTFYICEIFASLTPAQYMEFQFPQLKLDFTLLYQEFMALACKVAMKQLDMKQVNHLKDLTVDSGFGKLYKAEYMGKQIVVKDLYYEANKITLLDCVQEAYALNSLAVHPNIVGFEGATFAPDKASLAFPFYANGDIEAVMKKRNLTPYEKIKLMRQVAQGMQFMHENKKIHRDLKPANILIDDNGSARITDFGLTTGVQHGTICGTSVC